MTHGRHIVSIIKELNKKNRDHGFANEKLRIKANYPNNNLPFLQSMYT